jgi:hypothetical protein
MRRRFSAVLAGDRIPRKNVCAWVNITEICLANVMSSVRKLSKTQNGSDKERLRWFAFSVKMQAELNNERVNLKLEKITVH